MEQLLKVVRAKYERSKDTIWKGMVVFVILLSISVVLVCSVIAGSSTDIEEQAMEADLLQTSDQSDLYPVSDTACGQEANDTPAYTDEEVAYIAKTVYGEALVTNSDMKMAAVVWCILNRVDAKGYGCGGSIEDVVTFPSQFKGYSPEHPVTARIEWLVRDVLNRWCAEKNGAQDVGRVLPKEYLFFMGDGRENHFSIEYESKEYWDWSLPNPYEN